MNPLRQRIMRTCPCCKRERYFDPWERIGSVWLNLSAVACGPCARKGLRP